MKSNLFITAMMLTFLLCSVYGCSGKSDITGIWKGKLDSIDTDVPSKTTYRSTEPMELMLAQTDKSISGKVTVSSQSLTINSGVIVDNIISIEAGAIKIDATVNDKSMEGTLNLNYRPQGGLGSLHEVTGSFKLTKSSIEHVSYVTKLIDQLSPSLTTSKPP